VIYVHTGILCVHLYLMCTLASYVHTGILCTHWRLMCTPVSYVHTGILCAHLHLMCTLTSYVTTGILCAHRHLMCTPASYVHTHNNHTWQIQSFVFCQLRTMSIPLSLRLLVLRISHLDFLIPDYRHSVPSVFSQNLPLSVQCL
jgi:hypothetical protein